MSSIRTVSDNSGSVVESENYDPYGRSLTALQNSNADRHFAGLYQHIRSGLYLTEFRCYSPALASWLSRDTAAGSSQYTYAANSPLDLVDVTGLKPDTFMYQDELAAVFAGLRENDLVRLSALNEVEYGFIVYQCNTGDQKWAYSKPFIGSGDGHITAADWKDAGNAVRVDQASYRAEVHTHMHVAPPNVSSGAQGYYTFSPEDALRIDSTGIRGYVATQYKSVRRLNPGELYDSEVLPGLIRSHGFRVGRFGKPAF